MRKTIGDSNINNVNDTRVISSMNTMDSPPSEVSPDNDHFRTGNHKKRVRVWTEDDRAKHRVLEKSRREAFSDNLLSLARLLPNLASMKESKLSKHTIVDESLKYHQIQQAKLDELQKVVHALEAEKESLLTELSQWRRCLDTPPQQVPMTVPGEASREPTTHETRTLHDAAEYSEFESDLNVTYGGPLLPESAAALVPSTAHADSVISTNLFPSTALDIQQLGSYNLQQTALPFPETPTQYFSPLPLQLATDRRTHQEPPFDATTWLRQHDEETCQAWMPYQSYHNLPLDSDRYQFWEAS